MTRTPAVLHVTHSIRAAQRVFADKPYQHLPVLQGGRLIGIVSDRDVTRFLTGRPQAADLEIALAMTQDPLTVTADMFVEDAAALLIRHKIHSLPVVEDGDKLLGIITASDLLGVLVRFMQEHRTHIQAQDEPPPEGARQR